MSDINTVLERLITDPGFRQQIKEDPSTALQGYDLTEADLELLASQMSDESGAGDSAVETRTSKSSLAGLLGLFGGGSQESHGETDYDFVSRLAEGEELDETGRVKAQFGWDSTDDSSDAEYRPGKVAETDYNFETPNDADDMIFVKLQNVDGDSSVSPTADKDHDKWVDIQSVSPPVHKPGGGATADGTVDADDFAVWQDNLGDDSEGTPTNEIATEDTPDNSEDLPLSGEGKNGEEMITGYLEVPDIAGESQHADGGPVLEDAVVTNEVDASSQKPHEAAVAGADDLQVSGQDGEDEYVKVKLENAQITSYQLGVLDNDAIPGDTVDDLGSPDAPGAEAKKIIDSPNLMKWDNTTTEAPRQPDLAESVPDDEFPDRFVVTPIDEGGDGPVGDLTAEPEDPQEGDPDQPIVMGTVPNAENEGGIGSDGDLVQAVSEDAAQGDELDEVPTEMVQMNPTGDAETTGPTDIVEGPGGDADPHSTGAAVDIKRNTDASPVDGLAVDGLVGPKTEGGEPDLHTGDYMDDDLPPS